LIGGDDASNFDADIGDVDPKAQIELIAGIVGDLPAAVFWIGNAELTEARLWRHLRTLNMVGWIRNNDGVVRLVTGVPEK
jgi:hypothetical protein